MKKTVLILTGTLPFVYWGMIGLLMLTDADDEMLFGMMGLYTLMGIVLPILFSHLTAKADRRFLAVSNLWLYGGNLAVFLAEAIFWLVRLKENRIAAENGGMEGGLVLVLLILIYFPHWISYVATRLAGAVNCERSLQGICRGCVRSANTLLQLIPGADVISAIWVLRRITRQEHTE